MYETTDFRGVSTSDRLYLSVTRRTKAERLALYQSFDVAPPTCVAPAALAAAAAAAATASAAAAAVSTACSTVRLAPRC